MISTPTERVWTPVALIRWTEGYLAQKGFDEPRLNAELLLAGVLGLKRLDLYLQFERPLTPPELGEYRARLRRRLRHEPLQYIEGFADFRHLRLRVDPRVLIPRPETELLVGEVLAWSRSRPGLTVIDIGTGSGAIALSLRTEGDFGAIVATDVSEPALQLARENAGTVGAAHVDFRLGSLYEPLTGERVDVIVANPPYVAEADRSGLAPEVAHWEPGEALFAGADGLDVLRSLVAGAAAHLNPGGLLALEVGAGQSAAVCALVRATGTFHDPVVRPDLAGRDRIVLAERLAVPRPASHDQPPAATVYC
jgi:release factor glutamine methyltransferase